MKPFQSHIPLIHQLYLPIILGLGLLAFFAMPFVLWLSHILYIFLFFCLLLVFSRLGNQLIDIPSTKQNIFTSAAKIIIAQLVLLTILIWLCYSYNDITLKNGSSIETIRLVLTDINKTWGLYPWTLYALISVGVAVFRDKKLIPNTFIAMSEPFIKRRIHGVLGFGGELFLRQSVFVFISMTLGMIILTLFYDLTSLFNIQIIPDIAIIPLLIFCSMVFITKTETWNQLIYKLWFDKILLERIALLQSGLLIVILSLLSIIFTKLLQYFQIPNLTFSFQILQDHSFIPWRLFIFSLSLSATPVLAFYFSSLLTGLTVRTAIVLQLLLPIMIALIVWFKPEATMSLLAPAIKYLAILGFLALIACFWFSDNFTKTIQLLTYKTHIPKRILHFKLVNAASQLLTLIPVLYLLCGLIVVSSYCFAMCAVTLVSFSLGTIGLTRYYRL